MLIPSKYPLVHQLTVREAEDIEDKKVRDIDWDAALVSPERLANYPPPF